MSHRAVKATGIGLLLGLAVTLFWATRLQSAASQDGNGTIPSVSEPRWRYLPFSSSGDLVNRDGLSSQSVDPCEHLGSSRGGIGNYGAVVGWSPTDWVNDTNVIAKAVITDILPARFETASGSVPTPLPTQASDDDEDSYEDGILSPVVLEATHIYSGTMLDGYVVLRWGGSVPECPNYTYERLPQPMTGDVQDQGLAFLSDPPPWVVQDPPHWFLHLQAAAEALNSAGGSYEVKLLRNWYLYEPPLATSVYGGSTLITDLENEVAGATGP